MKLYELIPASEFENLDTECKAVLDSGENHIEGWAKSISAFSNSGEGHLYVGVSDDMEAFGLSRGDVDAMKRLVLLTIDRHVFPHVKVHFAELPVGNGKFVLDVDIPSYPEIVCLRLGDYNEKVFVRENGSSVPATVAQILQLGKRKYGADVRALDLSFQKKDYSRYLALARRFRKDGSEPSIEDLITLEAVTEDGRVKEGLFMFADEYNSDATLAVCRLWDGLDKGADEALDKKAFKGNLADVFQNVFHFIKRNGRSGFVKQRDGSRLDVFSYPELAVREVLVNALAHRDYSISNTQVDVDIYQDRLEISSPGPWLLSSSPEKYPLNRIPSIRRNRVICGCFEGAGLMEQSASGFKKVARIYEEYPEKTPFLENSPDTFTVVLYDLLFDAPDVESDAYEASIVDFCKGVARSREEIQEHVGIQSRAYFTSKILKPLLDKGVIKRTAPAKSPNVKYIS